MLSFIHGRTVPALRPKWSLYFDDTRQYDRIKLDLSSRTQYGCLLPKSGLSENLAIFNQSEAHRILEGGFVFDSIYVRDQITLLRGKQLEFPGLQIIGRRLYMGGIDSTS